jgi:hypothetical protein
MKKEFFKNKVSKSNLSKFYNEKILYLKDIKPLFNEEDFISCYKSYKWQCKNCNYTFS